MLRLTPSILSQALGEQLLQETAHLRPVFKEKLLPLISTRLLDPTLQRDDSGSISMGSALSLFLTSLQRAPKLIAEVGTYIGSSAAALGYGAGLNQNAVQLITCDINPCFQKPFEELRMPEGSKAEVVQGSSLRMFEILASKEPRLTCCISMERLQMADLKPLRQTLKSDTLIALDDCENDEKGHINLDLLRRSELIKSHIYVQPFTKNLFRNWGLSRALQRAFYYRKTRLEYAGNSKYKGTNSIRGLDKTVIHQKLYT